MALASESPNPERRVRSKEIRSEQRQRSRIRIRSPDHSHDPKEIRDTGMNRHLPRHRRYCLSSKHKPFHCREVRIFPSYKEGNDKPFGSSERNRPEAE